MNQSKPDERTIRRKKRQDRITLIIIAGLIAIFGLALLFRQQLRANFWAWRLTHGQDEETRGRLIASMIELGEEHAVAPAVGLTRSDAEDARLAGQEVLLGLLQQRFNDRSQKIREHFARQRDISELPDELRQPITLHPSAVQRFREMLDDESPAVAANAVHAVQLIRDTQSLRQLEELAIRCQRMSLAVAAVEAVERVGGISAGAALVRILGGAVDPSARAHAIELLGQPGEDSAWAFRNAETVWALVEALGDDRPVVYSPVSIRFNEAIRLHVQQILARQGVALPRPEEASPASQPELPDRPVTVGDFAARMLGAMIGAPGGLLSDKSPQDREKLIGAWRAAADEWVRVGGGGEPGS